MIFPAVTNFQRLSLLFTFEPEYYIWATPLPPLYLNPMFGPPSSLRKISWRHVCQTFSWVYTKFHNFLLSSSGKLPFEDGAINWIAWELVTRSTSTKAGSCCMTLNYLTINSCSFLVGMTSLDTKHPEKSWFSVRFLLKLNSALLVKQCRSSLFICQAVRLCWRARIFFRARCTCARICWHWRPGWVLCERPSSDSRTDSPLLK